MIFELLDAFRIRFSSRPLVPTLAFVALLALLGRSWLQTASNRRLVWRSLYITAAAGLLAYVGIAIYYGRDEHYYDYAEPTMTAVGWLFAIGKPVHHSIDSPERYAHMYGPLAFIAQGLWLRALGPSIAASKWLAVGASLASTWLLWLALRTLVDRTRAVLLAGCCALSYLIFRNLAFWTRPEPLQLLCISGGLYAAAAARSLPAALVVGASTGLMVNLKITGPLYSLPVIALLYGRFGARAASLAVVTAMITAALPFAIFPNVALDPYLLWVRLSAGNGLVLSTLRLNIEWALFFLLPVLLSRHAGDPSIVIARAERFMLRALLISICGVVLAASKPGATASHLVPFLPVIFYVTAAQLQRARADYDRGVVATATGFVLTLVLLALVQQVSFIREFAPRTADREADDIREFLAAHPADNVEMGYGREERLTLARPLTVFHDNSYFIDSPAVQEHQLDGLDLPPAAIQAVRECAADYWLIPHGQPPFSGPNRYPAMHLKPLFSEEFRRAFADAYALDGRTRYYDVWTCRTRGNK